MSTIGTFLKDVRRRRVLSNAALYLVAAWIVIQVADLASVLIKTGEQERADLLLDRALMILPTIPRLGMDGYRISDVRINALQGNTEAALASLRQAIDLGWRATWWFYLGHDISLESIRDEPEYQTMVEEIEADMAAQLERVRAMEANGELEPTPDIGFNPTPSNDLRQ